MRGTLTYGPRNRRLVERAKLVGALTRRSDLAARGVTDPDVLAENANRIAELTVLR